MRVSRDSMGQRWETLLTGSSASRKPRRRLASDSQARRRLRPARHRRRWSSRRTQGGGTETRTGRRALRVRPDRPGTLEGDDSSGPAAAVEPASQEAAPAGKPVPKEALFMYEQGGHRYYQVPDPGSPRGMRTVDEDTLQKEGDDLATLPKGEPVTTGERIHATQEGIQQTIDRPQREGDEGSRPLAEAKPGGGVQPGAPVVQGAHPHKPLPEYLREK